MSFDNAATPVITPPGQGRIIRAFGEEAEFLITGEQTGGRFTQWIETTPPGGGPPPHYHTQEDENFYVIEGCAEFFRDEASLERRQAGHRRLHAERRGAFLPQRGHHAAQNAHHHRALRI
jgi:oxalate decarboxylase/phosphoglucose isomerase-like protein (cupin superfamily)